MVDERVRVRLEDEIEMARAAMGAQDAWLSVMGDAVGRGRSGERYLRVFSRDADRRRAAYRSFTDAFMESHIWPMVAERPVMRSVFGRAFRGEALRRDAVAENRWRDFSSLLSDWAQRSSSPYRGRALAWVADVALAHADGIAAKMRGRELWSPQGAAVALLKLDLATYDLMRKPGVDRAEASRLVSRAYGLFEAEVAEDGVDAAKVVSERDRLVARALSSSDSPEVLRHIYTPAIVGMVPSITRVRLMGEDVASWDGGFTDASGLPIESSALVVRPPLAGPLALARAQASASARAEAALAVEGSERPALDAASAVLSDSLPDALSTSRAARSARRLVSDLSSMAADDGLTAEERDWALERASLAGLFSATASLDAQSEDAVVDLARWIPVKGEPRRDAGDGERLDAVVSAFAHAVQSDQSDRTHLGIVSSGASAVAEIALERGWGAKDVMAACGLALLARDSEPTGPPTAEFAGFCRELDIGCDGSCANSLAAFSRAVEEPSRREEDSRDLSGILIGVGHSALRDDLEF